MGRVRSFCGLFTGACRRFRRVYPFAGLRRGTVVGQDAHMVIWFMPRNNARTWPMERLRVRRHLLSGWRGRAP